MLSRLLPAAGLVFGSGAAALLYETAWLREFRLVFGSTTAASAVVLGIFMGGLGIGSAWLGRRAEAQARPLRFYARLELLIAASAALTPMLIWLVRQTYVMAGGTLAMGTFLGTLVRLVLSAVVLAAPTVLMGGTLPAIARFGTAMEDTGRRGLALLYGMNTLGAVAGAGLGTFVLFERIGNHRTLWAACLFNATIGLLALLLARHEKPLGDLRLKREQVVAAAAPTPLVLAVAAGTGFVFLLMELVWYRMLGPILAGTAFTFGLILAVALVGIASGGVIYGIWPGERSPTLRLFALTCALEAFFIAVPYAIGDRLAVAAMVLQPLSVLGFSGRVLGWLAICLIVIFPAAFIAGMQFPLLIGLLGRGRPGVALHTGKAYAWNTAGAIGGSLAGGFWLIPLLSAPGAWRLVVVLLAIAAIGVALLGNGGRFRIAWSTAPPLFAAITALALLFSIGPTAAWRHGQFGINLRKACDYSPNRMRNAVYSERRDILWQVDGVEASIGISKPNALAFIVNGKCDGNSKGDSGTQVMLGLLGALLHGHPTRAAVVGLGTGSTTGWLAAVPSMERVDVMELEPAIIRFAAQCAPVNHDAMQNPKTRPLLGDARELLLSTRETYDLVVSEPSNPYRAGLANLFTREYYQAAAAKLRPGGFFVQWLQTYDVDARTVEIFYRTFQSVYPHVETWHTRTGDLVVIGSMESINYDVPALRERIKQPPYNEALASVWRVDDLEGLFSRYVANGDFPAAFLRDRPVLLNTDDRPLLEFAFARSLSDSINNYSLTRLHREALRHETDRPVLAGGELDWDRVEAQRTTMFLASDPELRHPALVAPEQGDLLAVSQAYAQGDLAGALEAWRRLGREPQNLIELTITAECLAEAGDAAAVPLIERLRTLELPEAEAIAARLLWRQKHEERAAAMIQAAFHRFQSNPWPLDGVLGRALNLACEMAAEMESSDLVEQIYRSLDQPLAVYQGDSMRQQTRLEMGVLLDGGKPGQHTLASIQAVEPHIPWELNFLELREQCYTALGHPKARAAKRDIEAFIAAEGGSVRHDDDLPQPPVQRRLAHLADQKEE